MARFPRISNGSSAAAVDEDAPWTLEFDGSNHMDMGLVHPGNFMLGDTCAIEWIAKKMPGANGYIYAPGFGGAHVLLCGFSSGNVNMRNAGGTETTLQFGFDYPVAEGEVVQQAIVFGAGGIWSYTNDFLDGYTAIPAGYERFIIAGSANKRSTMGASGGHSGQPMRIARFRLWDRACPIVTASLPFHQRWERLTEEATGFEVSSVNHECDIYYPFWQRHTADMSALGVQGRDGELCIDGVTAVSGINGKKNGFLFHPSYGGEVQGTPGTFGIISGENYPRFVRDEDFKLSAAHTGVIPTASTMPSGARIWDSFKRSAQLFNKKERPTLGSTEGGTAGPLVWKQCKVHNGDLARRDFWGIMGGFAIPAPRNFGCAAWVEDPSPPAKYRVSVGCNVNATRNAKVTSLAARVRQTGVDVNGDPVIDCLFLFFDSSATSLRIGRITSNNLDFAGLPGAWAIPANYTEITLDVDDTGGTLRPGYRTSVGGPVTYLAAAFANTDFSGANGRGLFSGGGDRFGSSACRMEDFHVETLP